MVLNGLTLVSKFALHFGFKLGLQQKSKTNFSYKVKLI